MKIREMCRLLEDCTKRCHPWEKSDFLPTRLIDVGVDSSTIPRLVSSSDIRNPEEIKYAALSYCWGTEEDAKAQFKTDKASLEWRCKSLPYEMMTPASNDAVALTRAIGLRYVWVDALCIIQDDADDWLRESGQMGLVYSHAFVTFCGLNSDSCHETFLQRTPAVSVPFQSTIREDISGYYLIRLRPSGIDWLNGSTHSMRDRWLSRWGTRAWTYQEEELSTRLLLLGSSKMHFRCGRCKWSEGDDNLSESSGRKMIDDITRIKQGELPATRLYDIWLRMVDNYGYRLVTFQKDRLPAISGLARIVWETLGDHYLAGIWKGDIIRGLGWRNKGELVSHGLQDHIQDLWQREYIAPSWSWASCATGIVIVNSYYGWLSLPELMVVDVDVKTKSQNPFDQVCGGFLQIRGKVAPVATSLLPREGPEMWNYMLVHYINGNEPEEGIWVWLDWLSKGEEAELDNLVAVLLLQCQNEDEILAPRLYALVLHPADNSGKYYRVGLMESHGQMGYDLMRTWFESSRDETICII
jgi:hypothetical protein